MQKIRNTTPIFLDARGYLMDGGKVYIGVANDDPKVAPIDVFWDSNLTSPADQPIATLGGLLVNGVTPAAVFCAEADYSQRVEDSGGNLVAYAPSVFVDTDSFQPKDSDLTAIAALGTTAFGRALLTLPNQAALVAATGLPDALPKAGGTVTGNIVRQGAGVHAYYADEAMTGGRIFITAVGAPDPTSQPGDLWFQY